MIRRAGHGDTVFDMIARLGGLGKARFVAARRCFIIVGVAAQTGSLARLTNLCKELLEGDFGVGQRPARDDHHVETLNQDRMQPADRLAQAPLHPIARYRTTDALADGEAISVVSQAIREGYEDDEVRRPGSSSTADSLKIERTPEP